MKTELIPLTEEMIPEAGSLLAQRHKHNRSIIPLMPPRFEDAQISTRAIQALWQKKFKNGYAAFRDGKMTAYLLGDYSVQPWGRYGCVYLPGYVLAQGESIATIQDLYTLLGDEWVKKGVFSHGLYISAADANVIDALFAIGFGKERVDALMDLRTIDIPEVEAPSGVTIRLAGKGDNDYLGSLSDVIFRSLANAPYWHPTLPEDWEELREGWSELADDEEWTVRTMYLSVAATKPPARGRGISTTLSWHGLTHAQKDGFDICYTNWISPNLLASRFWPRFGFKDVAYRLAKRVNPMIAWTKR